MTNILTLPIVAASATTSQDGDCLLDVAFALGGSPVDLAGITFSCNWWTVVNGLPSIGYAPALAFSSGAGTILNGGANGIATLKAPQTSMQPLAPGPYLGDLVASADGATLVVAQLSVAHAALGPSLVTSSQTTPRT